jgi:spermidine synthase
VSSAAPRWALPFLTTLFFGSGACALVYQVMWLRLLALVFGVTVYAASTVLASFMAGLALGSFAAGRLAARMRSPLRTFGLLEIGVGITAFLTPTLLEGVKDVWVAIHPALPSNLVFVTAARFAASFAVLIVPTTLMGATLPIVMQSALVGDRAASSLGRRSLGEGGRIGLLYAINTTGAIVGALVAGFVFVSDVGISMSFRIAAAVNLAIGITAILAARRVQAAPRDPPPAMANRTTPQGEPLDAATARVVLWTFALSGLLSLALEIIWFRMLVVFLRPTAYAFTIMLAAVLAGIALGSAIATPLLRRNGPWLAVLTLSQIAIGVTAVLSFNPLSRLTTATERLAPSLAALGFDPYLGPLVIASLMAMLPTTLLLGFAFPIGLSLWSAGARDPARRIGMFYALNVCGAICGAMIGGFALLPLFGTRGSLIATSSLAAIAGVLLAIRLWRTRPNFAGFAAIAGPAAFAMSALNAADPFALAGEQQHRNEQILWRKEGVQTTVAVHDRRGSAPHRILYLDGMHQSDDLPSTAFVHHRIGALPALLHPSPRTALVVGLGGGATPGAVARFPGIDVDVVELSSAVAEASAFFNHINFGLLQRPNVHLRVDDGRNYLLTTRKHYDVITADIILPRTAGAGALYAKEYFELVRKALADGGLALQWNGAQTETPYKLIMRTFVSVFPHTTVWGDGSLMLGSKEPFALSAGAYEERRRNPQFKEVFDWDLQTIQRNYLAGPAEIARWLGPGPILTDDKPVIEYFLALPPNDPAPDLKTLQGRFEDVLRP